MELRLRFWFWFDRVLEVDFSESGVLEGESIVAGVGWGFDHGLLDGGMLLRNGCVDALPLLLLLLQQAIDRLLVMVVMESFKCSNDCGVNAGCNNRRTVAVL
jgi:hypothetical protein